MRKLSHDATKTIYFRKGLWGKRDILSGLWIEREAIWERENTIRNRIIFWI
jgi:hypothetical protein